MRYPLSYTNHKSAIQNQKSFTLIELLVVVAIIAVLVALLLPAIQEARRVAKNAVCLTQMQQLGRGLMSYAADNGDCLPLASWPLGVRGQLWYDTLGTWYKDILPYMGLPKTVSPDTAAGKKSSGARSTGRNRVRASANCASGTARCHT